MQYFKHKDLNINHYNIFLKIFSKINKFYLFDYYIETGAVIVILINWIYNARVDFTWNKEKKIDIIFFFQSFIFKKIHFEFNLKIDKIRKLNTKYLVILFFINSCLWFPYFFITFIFYFLYIETTFE